MMRMFRLFSYPLLLGMLAVPLRAEQVTIFAASSLKTALDQLIEEQSLDALAVYGGSAAMARQISQGAQADIIILAHPIWMDWLAQQGAISPESRCNILSNSLELAGPKTNEDLNPKTAEDLIATLKGGHLSVGNLRSVPAGQYAGAYLEEMGWLVDLQPHLVQTSNVRLALALVARGEAGLGLVYASDVFAEPRVRSLFTPAPENYPPIRYPMALRLGASSASHEVARALIQNSATFEEFGFLAVPLNEKARCS